MKRILLVISAVLFLMAVNLYAEQGDVHVEGKLGVGTTNPGANLDVQGTVKMFGAWTTKTANTVHQATTDGFIVAWSSSSYWIVKTDSNNPPTTVVMETEGATAGAGRPNATVPVRKGDYWKVEVASGSVPIIRWLPLGQ
jgi:hypothetical protein